jgi:hypothetical protein
MRGQVARSCSQFCGEFVYDVRLDADDGSQVEDELEKH